MTDDIAIRRTEPGDDEQIRALLNVALALTEHDAALLHWKHEQNPFGRSPAWVAVAGDRIVGYRTFLRWEFEHGDALRRAVRAVDTATHPDFQGRGIFTRLTTQAIETLTAEGVDFVFNTPNDNSRPGYLKMGWIEVGRLRARVRPRRSLRALTRLLRARAPAELASIETSAGEAAGDVLDAVDVPALLAEQGSHAGLRTHRSPAFLRWRYALAPLHYRALLLGDSADNGFVVFRLRRRGPAVEAIVCDWLVAPGQERQLEQTLRSVPRRTGADHAVVLDAGATPGFLPAPGGPILTWRALAHHEPTPLADWHLRGGDVELF
jgi:GNAT superfamily N-acetyltransferase